MDMADQLQKLHALREQGALTEDEYTRAKSRVLDGEPAAGRAPGPNPALSAASRFQRTLQDRWIGGVCGGIARQTQSPSWVWRILFVLAVLANGLGLLVYLLLWIFVPQEAPPAASQTERAAAT
ncbi:MAG TPA: PspC domain-containing protein [Usitatibacteraceae bacterium]|nr:PspC domain-containing protein [Usitatibacteraceae bacterium]